MEFEWDEEKRQSNIQKHGIDFDKIKPVFDKQTVEWVDNRKDYGETRFNLLGEIEGYIV